MVIFLYSLTNLNKASAVVGSLISGYNKVISPIQGDINVVKGILEISCLSRRNYFCLK